MATGNATIDAAYAAETLGPQLNLANWALTGVSLIFLLLRLYCKVIHGRGLWWDDHFLTASWITLLLSSSFQVASVANGYGHHVTTLNGPQSQATTLYYMVASTFLITASAWSKTSFAITLLRITDSRTKKFIWFLIVSMNMTKLVSAMLQWISCQPIEKSWNPLFEGGSCWDKMPIAYYNLFSGAYSGLADVILALLPWKVVMALQMRKREKIGVAIAMSMGIFAGITAFVKCAKIPSLFGGDFTYEGCEMIIWGSAETAATIMAASIPVLRVLIRGIKNTNNHKPTHSSGYYHYRRGGSPPGSPGLPGQPHEKLIYSLRSPALASAGSRGGGRHALTTSSTMTTTSQHRPQHSTVVTVTGGGRHHNHPAGGMGSPRPGADEGSEKSILNNDSSFDLSQGAVGGQNGLGLVRQDSVKGGIIQTNEVSIDYESTYLGDEEKAELEERERRVHRMA